MFYRPTRSNVNVHRNRCLLCGLELAAVPHHGVQRHPNIDTCHVTYTDAWGVALTDDQAKAVDVVIDDPPEIIAPQLGLFELHPPVTYVLDQLFKEHGYPRLGGASSGKGWSSFATAQRCLYAWRKRYVDQIRPDFAGENHNLSIGTLIHMFLALYYANMLGEYATLTPQVCYDYLLEKANP